MFRFQSLLRKMVDSKDMYTPRTPLEPTIYLRLLKELPETRPKSLTIKKPLASLTWELNPGEPRTFFI
ncbi:hypothetical protein HDU84_000995 [Entophlyctis sp. JEL0112]|nr:hypothetical protein HDU84_000995 [Entophlyctis sp. JEL0112]